MPHTIDAQENQARVTFTGMTLAEVQAYLDAHALLLTALRWHITIISGPGAGPITVALHRTLTPGDQQALEQALS